MKLFILFVVRSMCAGAMQGRTDDLGVSTKAGLPSRTWRRMHFARSALEDVRGRVVRADLDPIIGSWERLDRGAETEDLPQRQRALYRAWERHLRPILVTAINEVLSSLEKANDWTTTHQLLFSCADFVATSVSEWTSPERDRPLDSRSRTFGCGPPRCVDLHLFVPVSIPGEDKERKMGRSTQRGRAGNQKVAASVSEWTTRVRRCPSLTLVATKSAQENKKLMVVVQSFCFLERREHFVDRRPQYRA